MFCGNIDLQPPCQQNINQHSSLGSGRPRGGLGLGDQILGWGLLDGGGGWWDGGGWSDGGGWLQGPAHSLESARREFSFWPSALSSLL